MNKKLLKNLVSFAIILFLFAPVLAIGHQAHASNVGINEVNNTIQLGSDDPRKIIARVINTIMMFLGVIAVVIVLLAGFKWMMAAGNQEKVGSAKKLLGAGVIGLLIILCAWGIASYVLSTLLTATNNA